MQLTNIETPALETVQTNDFFPMSEMALIATMKHQQAIAGNQQTNSFMQKMAIEIQNINANHSQEINILSQRATTLGARIIHLQTLLNESEQIRQNEKDIAGQNQASFQEQIKTANQSLTSAKELLNNEIMRLTAEKTAVLQQVTDLQTQKVIADNTIQQQALEIALANQNFITLQERMNSEISRLTEEKTNACQLVIELGSQKAIAEQGLQDKQNEINLKDNNIADHQGTITAQQNTITTLQHQTEQREIRLQEKIAAEEVLRRELQAEIDVKNGLINQVQIETNSRNLLIQEVHDLKIIINSLNTDLQIKASTVNILHSQVNALRIEESSLNQRCYTLINHIQTSEAYLNQQLQLRINAIISLTSKYGI